ncbi:MAG: isoprenyl transferase [Candidatus Electrothrix sp. AR3]|nr:isoprenyl transferase [Candidatus Electrothrix sp. AR3]
MNFGIIADGNRRWAKKNQVPNKLGHKKGFLVIKDEILPILEQDPDTDTCTIYVFSTENWKRSPGEVKDLMGLFIEIADEFLIELLEKEYRVIFPGRRDRIPTILRKKIEKTEKISAQNTKMTIYVCLDYGGRNEIERAAAQAQGKKFKQFLEVPDLDIVFRTGGERRLSNFCIWQSAYAELFFVEKLLPEIKKQDIQEVLEEFRSRNRRKGH